MSRMTKLLIIPRSPENASFDFEGHGYYENFYPAISENFETVVLSTEYDEPETQGSLTYYPCEFEGGKIQGAKNLYHAIDDIEPDVIMTEHEALRTIFAFTVAKMKEISTVMKVEAVPKSKFKTYFSSILSDKISSVSYAVDGYLPRESTVVRPGTDFPEQIEPKQFSEDKETIGYLGRFHYDKGTDRLVEVAEEIAQKEGFEFKVAGIGDYKREELEKLDEEYEDFEFLDKIPTDDIFPYLAGLDATVVPSRVEGCTRVVVESLYAGTPTLAWAIEPHKEMIENKVLLVESIDELEQKIMEKAYQTDISWFNYEDYTVENEIEGMTEVIEEAIK